MPGKALEFADAEALQAAGVVPVAKQLLVDLQSLGWSAEKAEGLTLVDGKTLAVASDNDFGLGVKVKEKVGDAKDPTDYSTDGSGKLLLEGNIGPLGREALRQARREPFHRLQRLAGRITGRGVAIDLDRREEIEARDAIRARFVLERRDRSDRHHGAAV